MPSARKLPQTISEGLAGALQRAADLKASWGDDFVSAEHLLQVSPWRAVFRKQACLQ